MDDLKKFDVAVLKTLPRYLSLPHTKPELVLKDEDGNIIHFGNFYPQQYEQWKSANSEAERKKIIYSVLDNTIGKDLEVWQQIERFNDGCMAEKALEVALNNMNSETEEDANYWSALARTYLILTNYEDAEKCCLKSFVLDDKNIRAQRIYADTLYCLQKEKEAHEIYYDIIDEKLPKEKGVNLPLSHLLGFDGDIVNSPIYAFGWLSHDENITEELWEWAYNEFYYSPYFRSQYAYFLFGKQENEKGLTILIELAKEMPWYKEAVINAASVIDQLNMTNHFAEEKKWFESIIKDNNWE